jgi:hypothetical protein
MRDFVSRAGRNGVATYFRIPFLPGARGLGRVAGTVE